MDNQHEKQTQDFINSHLALGASHDQIASQLRATGWSDDHIAAAFARAQPQPIGQPAPVVNTTSEQYRSPVAGTLGKAHLNPFRHLGRGIKNVFQTNPGPLVIMGLIATVVSVVSLILVLILVFGLLGSIAGGSFVSFFLILAIVAIPLTIINMFNTQILTRIALLSSRRLKAPVLESVKFSASRFWLAVKLSLVILGIIAVAVLVATAAGRISPAITALLMLVYLVVGILYALRLAYSLLVIVDDEKPASVKAVYSRSREIWGRSHGSLILYGLLLLVIAIILNSLDSSSQPIKLTPTSGIGIGSLGWGAAIVSVVISSIISTAIDIMLIAGLADIYDEVTGTTAEQTQQAHPTTRAA